MATYCFFQNLLDTAHNYNINVEQMHDYTDEEMSSLWNNLVESAKSAGIREADRKNLMQFANHIRLAVGPEFCDSHLYQDWRLR